MIITVPVDKKWQPINDSWLPLMILQLLKLGIFWAEGLSQFTIFAYWIILSVYTVPFCLLTDNLMV